MKLLILLLIARFSFAIDIYDLQVKIGDKLFHDILSLKVINTDTGEIRGEFEVENVFKVPVFGILKNGHLEGYFIANENGEDFKVDLRASFTSQCTMEGSLSQVEVSFANFIGKKRGCHE